MNIVETIKVPALGDWRLRINHAQAKRRLWLSLYNESLSLANGRYSAQLSFTKDGKIWRNSMVPVVAPLDGAPELSTQDKIEIAACVLAMVIAWTEAHANELLLLWHKKQIDRSNMTISTALRQIDRHKGLIQKHQRAQAAIIAGLPVKQ